MAMPVVAPANHEITVGLASGLGVCAAGVCAATDEAPRTTAASATTGYDHFITCPPFKAFKRSRWAFQPGTGTPGNEPGPDNMDAESIGNRHPRGASTLGGSKPADTSGIER